MKNLFIFIAFFISFNSYSQENIVLTGNKKEDAIAYFNRGLSKAKLQDYRGAIADYNKAIELTPDDVGAYNNRGIAKKNLQDYRGAIADYNKAIELEPNYSKAYYNRGNAKYELKDLDGACLDWSKAGELGDSGAYDLIKQYCN